MALKYEVDDIETVDEGVRGLYAEHNGKFRLNVEGVPKGEDTSGLKSALQKERERAKQVERYESIGLSPDEIQAMVREKEEAEHKRLEAAGDFKAILAQHKEAWEKERSELAGRADSANNALQRYIGESALTTALARAGATEEGLALLPGQLMSRVKVAVNGDRPAINLVAADGETPMAGTSEDGKATMDDLVADAAKRFPSLFRSDAKGGGGKPQTSGAGSNASGKDWAKATTPKEKAEILRSKMPN